MTSCYLLDWDPTILIWQNISLMRVYLLFAMAIYRLLNYLIPTLFLGLYLPGISAELEDTGPEVTILQGTLQGTTLTSRKNRAFSAFLGIPYAQPPIGDLRFASPVAADSWDGIYDATTDAPMCPQLSSGNAVGEEDCLYINVYAPQSTGSSLLPVMVFLHGGAFKRGSSKTTVSGPHYIMDEDVVFVLPNYRLGPLGFLSTGDAVASGNWGLKDQVLALQWVQDNIEYFGGDPDRVTLYGSSAGAVSTHLLALSNATVGLFHRYVLQSGSALATWAYKPRAAYSKRAYELGEHVGCSSNTSESLISCLRTVDVADLLLTETYFIIFKASTTLVWGPTDEPDIDGAILSDSPSNLYAAGKIRDLPCMFGVVRDEGLLKTAGYYVNEEEFSYFVENFDELMPELAGWTYLSDSGASWTKAVKSFYFNDDLTLTSELLANLTRLVSDTQFFYPAYEALLQQYLTSENTQYFYTLNYRGTYSNSGNYGGSVKGEGVVHSDSLIYLFNKKNVAPDGNLTLSESDSKIVDTMVEVWTSFAINGTPTVSYDDHIEWDPYTYENNIMRIGNESDTTPVLEFTFLPERMAFWTSLDASLEP